VGGVPGRRVYGIFGGAEARIVSSDAQLSTAEDSPGQTRTGPAPNLPRMEGGGVDARTCDKRGRGLGKAIPHTVHNWGEKEIRTEPNEGA